MFLLYSSSMAVGMVDAMAVMIAAVVVSVGLVMLFAAGISRMVSSQPTIKILALALLVAVGVVLVAESSGYPVFKEFVYFAMVFSLSAEMLEIWMLKRSAKPVNLHDACRPSKPGDK